MLILGECFFKHALLCSVKVYRECYFCPTAVMDCKDQVVIAILLCCYTFELSDTHYDVVNKL